MRATIAFCAQITPNNPLQATCEDARAQARTSDPRRVRRFNRQLQFPALSR